MNALDFYLAGIVCLAVLLCFVFHAVRVFRRAAEAGPLRDEVQRLLQEKTALTDEIAEAHRTLAELGRQIDAARAKIEAGKDIIAKAEKDKQELEKNGPLVAQLRAEEASLREQVKNLTDKRNELQETKDSVQKEKEELETSVRDLKTEQARLSDSIAEKNQELETVKRRLDGHKEELATIDKELVPKREELERLKAELAKLEGLKKELARTEEELSRKKNELRTLDETIASRRPEADRIVSDARSKASQILEEAVLSGKNRADQLVQAATGNLAREKTNLQKEIDKLQEAKAQLIADVGELKQRNGSAKDCWKELDRAMFPNVAEKGFKRNSEAENQWLNSFRSNLKNHGLVFHDRVVNAFHTGLKVADASPLVVLAGISGTGKSLLPQLYARAAGMNFLPLAVQPRWDSPQDMLGFYNYMEKRYKATEFARLLWQYDIRNNPEARKAFGAESNLPMNLVLLDEMNIARVEYYFSDFLSKLEIRRTEPGSAEIEIEGGVPTGADKAEGKSDGIQSLRRLFPGRNTLFVGTMNEDESTQTLSDKVIDRSNVIRFGRPAKLDASSDAVGFMGQYGTERRMAFESWREWVVDADDYSNRTRTDVFRVASALNARMEALGRPFGLRNVQAMLAYCENYPVQGDDGFKLALADQIEMKVLPKLNGLETDQPKIQDALRGIGEILESEIGDADEEAVLGANGNPQVDAAGNAIRTGLCKAFDEAMKPDSGAFFKWKGISR